MFQRTRNASEWLLLEKRRERRLWITQVIVPGVLTGIAISSNKELMHSIKTYSEKVRDYANEKLNRFVDNLKHKE